MPTGSNYSVSAKGHIYTLAESGTQKNCKTCSIAMVSGKGTNILNNPSLANRARRKLITRKMVLALIDVCKEKGEPERATAYCVLAPEKVGQKF